MMIKNDSLERQLKSIATDIVPSEEALEKLKTLKPKRTNMGKKLFMVNVATIMLSVLLTSVTAFAAYSVSASLYEKVKDANLSQNEIEQLDQQLHEEGFSEENIADLHELNVNQNGQTYGPDALGAELIEVIADDGKIGYVYRSELDKIQAQNLNDALKYTGQVVTLTVYEKDGITITGTFTLTDGKEK